MHMTNPCRITNIMARMQSMAPPFPPEGTPQQYTVLLVVLAGLPEDVGQLREALAAIAHLPLLVVVAGLGSADFSSLQVRSFEDSGDGHSVVHKTKPRHQLVSPLVMFGPASPASLLEALSKGVWGQD